MALFPQFPYSNLHELNLDWLIEKISQLLENGTVISVNGLSGVVTLYTEKDVVFPDRAFDPDWSVYRRIAEKHAGLQFTGEKFYYITKNVDDDDFTIQEVYTSGNLPPFPVTSVNGQTGDVIIAVPVTSVNERTGAVVLAGDNIPYNIDGTYTIEDIITPLEKSIGHVIRYNTCSEGVTAGQYVYLIMSGISGRSDGLYKAVNAKSAGTVWTSADLAPVAGGVGALMAQNDSAISELNSKVNGINFGINGATFKGGVQVCQNYVFKDFEYVDLYLTSQGVYLPCIRIFPHHTERKHGFTYGYLNDGDNGLRFFICSFETEGNHVNSFKLYMSNTPNGTGSPGAFVDVSTNNILYVSRIIGYKNDLTN